MIRILSELLYGYYILQDNSLNDLSITDNGLILLKENPNSCYKWKYTISDNNIIKFSSKIELYVRKENVQGGRKAIIFIFEPITEGICNISFKKYKSWENQCCYIDELNYFICIKHPLQN